MCIGVVKSEKSEIYFVVKSFVALSCRLHPFYFLRTLLFLSSQYIQYVVDKAELCCKRVDDFSLLYRYRKLTETKYYRTPRVDSIC